MNFKEKKVGLLAKLLVDTIERNNINEFIIRGKRYVKVRKGKWIPVTNGRGGHECSVCHAYAPSYQNSDEFMSDFCPYCGADMRGDRQ